MADLEFSQPASTEEQDISTLVTTTIGGVTITDGAHMDAGRSQRTVTCHCRKDHFVSQTNLVKFGGPYCNRLLANQAKSTEYSWPATKSIRAGCL
jgi:hypothetical protein